MVVVQKLYERACIIDDSDDSGLEHQDSKSTIAIQDQYES